MGEGNTRPYFTRLRVLARRAGYFYQRLAALDESCEDCPAICRSPHADPANGCPECEYTNALRVFRKEYELELRREYEAIIKQGVPRNTLPLSELNKRVETEAIKPPDFDTVYAEYVTLLSIEEVAGTETKEAQGGHNPRWSVRTAEAIRVIREERRRVRRRFEREADAKMRARLKALGIEV